MGIAFISPFLIFKNFIMKELMLFMIGSAIFATSAVAQNADQPVKTDQNAKQAAADWEKKVKDDLKLTDEQTVKYDAISKEYKEKMDAVMNDASLTKDVQKEKKMALKKEKQAKLMEFLSAEQQAKYNEMMEKKKKDPVKTA
jgi:Spy/CpxP family protein refolding chaperone